jgi:glycosyltransferase involved in cell wall biosynthesis
MTISVIIPTLNEAQNIRATLDRLHHHTAFSEILAAEGGSQDETAALAAPIAKVLTAPTGRARQMNTGAATASGDVLASRPATRRSSCGGTSSTSLAASPTSL